MNLSIYKKLTILSFFLALNCFAVDKNVTVTPIIGIERFQKFYPTPSMKLRTVYGARAVYKLPISSLEGEYTHGEDTTYYALENSTYKDVGDKVKLGLRGGIDFASFFTFSIRGGAEAAQNKITKSLNGVDSVLENKTQVNPYVGAGLSVNFMQVFSLNAEVTAVYKHNTTPGLSDYEITPVVGFTVSVK